MDPIPAQDDLPSPVTIISKALLTANQGASSSKDISSPITVVHRALSPDDEGFPSYKGTGISNRLIRLARLPTLHGNSTEPFSLDAKRVEQCLNKLESLLDPQFSLSQSELAEPDLTPTDTLPHRSQNRPSQGPESDPGADTSPGHIPIAPKKSESLRSAAPASSSKAHHQSRSLEELSTPLARTLFEIPKVYKQVNMFGNEVRKLGDAFLKRREETLYIYSLHDRERKRMRGRIAELEAEIEKLQADMQQDMAAREALQGTVHGFEIWIDGCRDEYRLTHKKPKENLRQGGGGWWSKKKVDKPDGFDADALFDGITAWLRGWADVEEEFRDQDRARRLRRNGKNRQEDETIDRGSSAID
ncbi:uncharacterized protein DSM5745_01405 [Aspergillus mulundensis]|uniref:Uncharacterized protein n=1 Tax=Aspergillus mulundensis TaxID=1810919 RepID=A0A3D8T6A7_9EURO|nr:hypothetical protein DSM5745_01405 [Aspergillus mulundensis]RDW94083.1 hypothetical protein DSM5745_01405 [Aspergillus mulundensis]